MNIGPTITLSGKQPFKDIVEIEFQPGLSGNSVASPPEVSAGVPSLFNPYAVVVFPSLGYAPDGPGSYNMIYDGASPDPGSSFGNRFSRSFEKSNPVISTLVEDAELAKKTPYYYTDFLYSKWVGKIPNNQLITLRRYPAPTFDNLAVPAQLRGKPTDRSQIKAEDLHQQDEFFPIAQAVTWFGEETGNKLSEILSFTTTLNWKNVEAEVNVASGNEQGSDDSPAPGAAKWLGILTGQVNTPFATQNSQYDPYNSGPYSHRVYGPVNVISKTYKRDRGLDFKQSISLTFEYTLKSIGNINPKAAMLDLMSNLLSLTYNNAAFWGGANRYFPQKPTYPFLGGKEGMNAWYRGQPLQFAKSAGAQIKSGMTELGNMLARLAEDSIGTLKEIASGAAKLGMIEMSRGKAPSIVALKALLTGEPIGEWHLVIGNPYKPIAKIGNLICTESKFQFNDTIGADNFPTELKVVITVEHGRPRDAGDIQSIFNEGQGRIYYPPKNFQDALNDSASTQNSKNDTSWKVSGNSDFSKDTSKVGLFTGSAEDFDQLLGTVQKTAAVVQGTAKEAFKTADLMFLRAAASGKLGEK